MAVSTTEERLAKLRAATVEAKLKIKSIKNEMKQKEKKERARRLFKYGEIVEKHFGGVSIEQLEFCLKSGIMAQIVSDALNNESEEEKEEKDPAETYKKSPKRKTAAINYQRQIKNRKGM